MAFRHFTEVSLMIRSEVGLTFFEETSRPVALPLSKARLFPLADPADCRFFDVRDVERFDIG